jgi:hypothetical protein
LGRAPAQRLRFDGAAARRGDTRLRWGLQNACSHRQWRRLRPIVQRNCAPEIWAEMAAKFGLDGEGAIV